jgi:hypothetical protein
MPLSTSIAQRLRASGIHLGICLAIAAIAAAQIFLVWYPNPIQIAMGANNLFWLILGIDVILGPLLTFVVFNPAKKSLKMDLSVIALVQVVALGYGLFTMYQGKAAYIAFNKDRFHFASVNEVESEWYTRPKTHKEFSPMDKLLSPKFAVVDWPTDVKGNNDLLFSNSSARVDAYIPIEQGQDQIKKASKPAAELAALNPTKTQELTSTQDKWRTKGVTQLNFVPLRAEKEDMAVLVDGQTGRFLEIARFNPWPL